jgi:hypothetical protein
LKKKYKKVIVDKLLRDSNIQRHKFSDGWQSATSSSSYNLGAAGTAVDNLFAAAGNKKRERRSSTTTHADDDSSCHIS